MLEARNLKKVYKIKNGNVVNALDGVSLKLPDTGMVFILGKSGSGKSTLLNVLGGLDSFDSGEIIIKGSSAKDFKQSHYDSYRNTYIGFIFQEYNVLEELTVGANIALAIELQGRRATSEEINAILKEVDLDGLGQRKPNELSGGQKQRVAIARALVKKPEIIMADEPTGALDSVTGKQVFDTLKKLSSDKLVLIVSHDREFSEQYADRIIELKDGKIISDVEKTADADVLEPSASPTDSITYGEGEITLKGGYSLTEEDRLAINEYLKAYADGAVIKVGRSGQKKYSSKDFAPTDESKIKSDKTGNFTLIKSRLSIKNAFKLGSGALKYKKLRLVITIFLSLISFTLFGVADTIAAYDNISTATNSIYDTGVNYASYTKLVKQVHGDYVYWTQDSNYLTPAEIELIGEMTGRDIIGIYKKRNDDFSFDINLGNNKVEGMTPSVIYAASFSGIAAIDKELIEEHGFSLLGDSRLPEKNKNEIVITKYVYDYFEKVGHSALGDTGEVKTDIKSVADILGKKITFGLRYNDSTEYTVVGVVDTGFDITRYEPLAADDAEFNLSMIESMALMAELDAAREYSFACVCFVHTAIMDELVEQQSAQPEKIENSGSVEIFKVISDEGQIKQDLYGDDRSNVLTSFNFSALYSLENIKDSVVWLGTPKTVLADNQIILSEKAIREIMSGGYYMLSDAHRLTGYEKTIYDKYKNREIYCYTPTLFNHFQNPKYFAAFSYAYNNLEEAKAAYADYLGVDNVVEHFDNFSYEFYDAFSRAAASGSFNEIINDTTAQKYVNDLATKYGLTSMLISDAVREAVVATCTYKGIEYSSYDTQRMYINTSVVNELDNILAYKYVFENFSDALSFAKLKYPESEHDNIDFWSAVSLYYDHIIFASKAPDGFIPTATVDFESYKLAEIVKLYTLMRGENKLVIATYSDRTFAETLIKNVEVVGIFNDDGNYDRVSAIGVSEGIINSILGPNRGGIYSFAVGTMPADKSDIRELVKFTKTYESEDGSVKYNLSNNVTLQLDMVDEILNVLGKVFVYVGIGLAVFASLMLANFISTSITYKKQEIGILRAIGSRSRDVFQIFFAESFIIAMISYVLSVIGTFTVTTVVNSALRNNVGMLITILNFSIREVGLLLLISLLVAFVATFFPVNKIASMKPIDAIKNRK